MRGALIFDIKSRNFSNWQIKDKERARRQGLSHEEIISYRNLASSLPSLVLSFSLSSIVHSFFFSTAVVDRRCLPDSPFTDAYRYTFSRYYRNHSAARCSGTWPTFSQCVINDPYYFLCAVVDDLFLLFRFPQFQPLSRSLIGFTT